MNNIASNFYLLGVRAKHHAFHSGYEGFTRYVGKTIKSPVNFRWMTSNLGWKIDNFISSIFNRQYYSLGAFLAEIKASFHMIFKRKSVYHVIYGDMDIFLLPFFAKITNNALVATFHEPPQTLDWLCADKTINKLHGTIFVSNYQLKHFANKTNNNNLFVVPHGVDTEFFMPADRPVVEPICITVGSQLRDFTILEQAMKMVWETNPQIKLIAIGTRRKDDSNRRLELDDPRVQYLDGIDDNLLLESYRKSQIAILPLSQATANNALLEAMSCGLPVIVTDIGGIREYIDENGAIFCKPGDSRLMAANILKLIDNKERQAQMSKHNRTSSLTFDFKKVAKQMDNIYTQIQSDL